MGDRNPLVGKIGIIPFGKQMSWRFFVANHRRMNAGTTRRIVAASAAVATMTVVAPGVASAAEVSLPGTGIGVEVQGIENVPGIASIPGIEEYIPSLAGQAAPASGAELEAIIAQVQSHPLVGTVPGLSDALAATATKEAAITPAAAVAAAAPAAVSAPVSGNQAVVDAVRSKLGAPYVYGAAGPSSFDCSGLTSWAYAQSGKSIPRTSQAQAAAGQQVAISDLQPGDIIAYYGGASHVAVYVGNGMMIDALNSGSPVAERPIDYMPIHSAFRF